MDRGLPKRVFVSFDYDDDKTLKDLLIGQAKNPGSSFEIHDWSIKESPPRLFNSPAQDAISHWSTKQVTRIGPYP